MHHGRRINHAQRQLKIREAVTSRAHSLHSCAGLPVSLPAFLATLLKTSDVRIVDHTHVPAGHVLEYYLPLLAMFDYAAEERFLKPENRGLVLARDWASEMLRALEEWRQVRVEKWLDRETRRRAGSNLNSPCGTLQ